MRLAKEWPAGPLVFGHDKEIAEFVSQRVHNSLERHRKFGNCTTIGVIRFRKLLGGVVYHDYHPDTSDVSVTFAFDDPRWATPSVMRSVCAYPFMQLKCNRVTAIVRRKNKHSRVFIEKGIGFKLEGCVRKGFGNDDAMIYGLLRHECRWLEDHKNNG